MAADKKCVVCGAPLPPRRAGISPEQRAEINRE